MIYTILLIPFIATIVAYFSMKSEKIRLSILIGGVASIILSFLAIVIIKSVYINNVTLDNEFHGFYYVKAQRVEAYTTWVDRTCYRTETYTCGTDDKGNSKTCTREIPYDCSYCDEHPEYYLAFDNNGKQYDISRDVYYTLVNRWRTSEIFHELNRNIVYSHGCGEDGDMYNITWNGDEKTAYSISVERTYTNKLQAAHTIYDFENISDLDAIKLGLYKYPKIDNNKQQTPIVGDDLRKYISNNEYDGWYNSMYFINGSLGKWKQAKVFLLLYPNITSQDIAIQQENYWKGGNKNEINICVGYSQSTGKIYWVRTFTWCEDKSVEVQLNHDIQDLVTFNQNLVKLKNIIKNDIIKYYKRRHFKDFNYINVDLGKGAYTWALVTTFLIMIGAVITLYQYRL